MVPGSLECTDRRVPAEAPAAAAAEATAAPRLSPEATWFTAEAAGAAGKELPVLVWPGGGLRGEGWGVGVRIRG